MATYAIGDVQGCAGALHQLLTRIPFDDHHDRLWFVGDLVNRGPDSAEVLRTIRALGDRAITVLGNHDLYLLAVAEGIMPLRPKDTLHTVLDALDRDALLAWVRQQPLLYRQGSTVLVHAGLLPHWTADQAVGYAREVEQALQGPAYRETLRALFLLERVDWTQDLSGPIRLKAITDVLTRIRTCTVDGRIDHKFKGEPKYAPVGYRPWFEHLHRRHADSTIVFGHWSALGLHLTPTIVGLDSGCVWGRTLTAVRLEDRQVFSVSCESCRKS